MSTELKKTALAVRHWRNQHSGPMRGLEVTLQQRVVRLLEDHSWDEVCTAVGVGRSQLSVWRRAHREHLQLRPRRRSQQDTRSRSTSRSGRRSSPKPATGFIEVPLPLEAPRHDVEIKLPTGIVVCARSGPGLAAVGELVISLLDQSAA